MNLLAELRRRNVIRMAGLNLVGAWLITQVSSTVLPMFGAPDWLPRSIVILLAIGFLPALIFSWIFELTPQGLKRDAEVAPEQSIAPQTGRRMNYMIFAVLVPADRPSRFWFVLPALLLLTVVVMLQRRRIQNSTKVAVAL